MSKTLAAVGGHRIDTARRAAEIVGLLMRFGFGSLVRDVGLDRFHKGGGSGRGGRGGDGRHPAASEPLPVRVRILLEELGPTFVKAGQIMSTRPDMLPADWITELAKLQSDVPPAPWEGEHGVRSVLEEELGERLETEFERIEETPLAAASMAQVHRATLVTGEEVVLKILRPGIRRQMASDLELARMFARLLEGHIKSLGFDALAVVREFTRELHREMDLSIEAESTRRMRRDFADNDRVTFPRVYGDLSTASVLVTEEIKGRLLSEVMTEGLPAARRERIVKDGAAMVFRQCLVIGFFHADPHPGNIIVMEDDRLCFIDCGMTGLIDPATIEQLATIVHGAVEGRLDAVVRVAIDLADGPAELTDDRAFRADVWQFVDRFHGGSLHSIRLGRMLTEFFAALRRHHLQCPSDIVYLIKALTTIEGVAEQLAPEFDLVAHVRPHVEHLVKRRFGLRALKERIEGAAIAYGDMLESLPHDVSDFMRALRRNELTLRIHPEGVGDIRRELGRSSMNIAWSMVIAAMIIGSSMLVVAESRGGDKTTLRAAAILLFFTAVFLGLSRMTWVWWRSRRQRDDDGRR